MNCELTKIHQTSSILEYYARGMIYGLYKKGIITTAYKICQQHMITNGDGGCPCSQIVIQYF